MKQTLKKRKKKTKFKNMKPCIINKKNVFFLLYEIFDVEITKTKEFLGFLNNFL